MQPTSGRVEVRLRVNGVERTANVEPRTTLADLLRDHLGSTGTHLGCEHGVCGACSVIANRRLTRACCAFAVQFDGGEIETVEGLARNGELEALQEAFLRHRALQCGFCTPGFLMLAAHFLRSAISPDDDEIRAVAASNLCRCTGYGAIVAAISDAAAQKSDNPPRGRAQPVPPTGTGAACD